MDNKADRTRHFSDSTVSIYHAAKRVENDLCDRMVVQHFTGNQEDVVIYKQSGQRRVGRLRMQLKMIPGSSPAIPVSTFGAESLEPVDPRDEERLLAIFDSVESAPENS